MLRQADELIETKFLNKTTKKKRNKRFGLAGWIMGWGGEWVILLPSEP